MIELPPEQFAAALPLFQTAHYGALALATLEGTHPGRVFVDNAPSYDGQPPAAGLVCARAGLGYYFLAGQPEPAFLAGLRATLLDHLLPAQKAITGDPVALLFYDPPAWKEPLFASLGDRRVIDIRKKRLVLPPEAEPPPTGALPPGLRLDPFTPALFAAHPQLAGEPEFFYGSREAFFQHGLGLGVFVDDQPACACFSVFTACGEAEISIATAEPFRRRGLAFLAAAAFIHACRARDLAPVWGCWPENQPSVALARKLGFVETPDQSICLLEV